MVRVRPVGPAPTIKIGSVITRDLIPSKLYGASHGYGEAAIRVSPARICDGSGMTSPAFSFAQATAFAREANHNCNAARERPIGLHLGEAKPCLLDNPARRSARQEDYPLLRQLGLPRCRQNDHCLINRIVHTFRYHPCPQSPCI